MLLPIEGLSSAYKEASVIAIVALGRFFKHRPFYYYRANFLISLRESINCGRLK